MIIQLHTPEGIIEKDTTDMTQEELEALSLGDYKRVGEILATSPEAITMPKMWELLRIFGRDLGYIE